jgi:hypothetical protein
MPRTYKDVLRDIATEGPPLFIMGGVAEDALLDGRMTRPHDDLDVLVLRDDVDGVLERGRALGFDNFELLLRDPSGATTVLNGQDTHGLHLELCIADRDGEAVSFNIEGGDGAAYRIVLPDDAFDWPRSLIEGTPVQTVSPRALYDIRAGLAQIGAFGGLREKDIASQERLRERFFAERSASDLAPRVERLEGAGG